MLDGQRQRVNVPVHARTAHDGILQKGMEEDICWIALHAPPPPTTTHARTHWIELNTIFALYDDKKGGRGANLVDELSPRRERDMGSTDRQ